MRDKVIGLEGKLGEAVRRGGDAARAKDEAIKAVMEEGMKARAALQEAVS